MSEVPLYATSEGRLSQTSTSLGLAVGLWRNPTILSDSAIEATFDCLLSGIKCDGARKHSERVLY